MAKKSKRVKLQMIYLDYAANTPINQEVLQYFCEVANQYPANPNSSHQLGVEANTLLFETSSQIAELLNVKPSEIIYTSGASESNNLAIKGIAQKYKKFGKHIITTYLEHSSVSGAMVYLQDQGFTIDYVDILPNGLVDLEHLKELLRNDTILVSICYVDSEIGLKQETQKIAELISDYPNCIFHTDATQAVGKIHISTKNVDLISFASHKFYGLNGCGVLIKKENILLEPLIHGGISTTPFRSGTPALSLIASLEKALSLCYTDMTFKYKYVEKLNNQLREAFKKYSQIKVNSTAHSVPFILNISTKGAKSEYFLTEFEKEDIYLSSKSACCAPNTVSRPVYAITKDKKLALSTLRISLSHLTSENEIDRFLDCFDKIYNKLIK